MGPSGFGRIGGHERERIAVIALVLHQMEEDLPGYVEVLVLLGDIELDGIVRGGNLPAEHRQEVVPYRSDPSGTDVLGTGDERRRPHLLHEVDGIIDDDPLAILLDAFVPDDIPDECGSDTMEILQGYREPVLRILK